MMRTRRKLILVLLGCGVVVAVLVVAFRWHREPWYRGRSLSAWVDTLDYSQNQYPEESQVAIRHMGSDAVPYLLEWLQPKTAEDQYRLPGKMRMRLARLSLNLPQPVAQPLVRKLLISGVHDRQRQAFMALTVLGPEARSAIPTLTRMIETPSSGDALAILTGMGDEGVPPILAVITNRASPYRAPAIWALAKPETKYTFNQTVASTLMSCLDDSDFDVAFEAADLLCAHDIAPERVLFPVIDALERDDQIDRRSVTDYLHAAFARNFSMAALIQLLQDTNSAYSCYAAGGLGQLARRAADLPEGILPALTNSLRDPRLPVRRAAVSALDLLGDAAEPAVPALLDAWSDPDYKMRLFATNAVCDMTAYAVLRDMSTLSGKEALSESEKIDFFKETHKYTPGSQLEPLLNHSDVRIREMATNAFKKLQGSNGTNQTTENRSP